jgi:ubiquinone/menaquinone biosynthesis C-methylase UbiE
MVERIERVVPLTPALTALDFGAGTGLVTLQLLPKVGFVYALDPSAEMLAQFRAAVAATAFRDYEIVTGVIADFTGQVDIVTCSLSLHHTPDLGEALRGIFRALRPGGRIFVVEIPDRLGIEELAGELRTAGFADIASEEHLALDLSEDERRSLSKAAGAASEEEAPARWTAYFATAVR